MTRLIELLARFFDRRIRERGARYMKDVVFVRSGDDGILATVQGTRRYEVRATVVAGVLRVSCDCPHGAEGEEACKHEWAVLSLAAVRGRLPREGRGITEVQTVAASSRIYADGGARLEPAAQRPRTAFRALGDRSDDDDDDDEEEDEDDDDDDDDDDDAPDDGGLAALLRRTVQHLGTATPPSRRETPSPWRSQLAGVRVVLGDRRSEATGLRGRRLLYVLDARASGHAQALVVDTCLEEIRAQGQPERATAIAIPAPFVSQLDDPADRRLLALLGAAGGGASTPGSWSPQGASRRQLGPPMPFEIVEAMCATGRARLRRADPKAALVPLAWDGGAPWGFRLRVRRAGGQCVLEGMFGRDGEELPLATLDLVAAAGIFAHDGRVARFDGDGYAAWIGQLRSTGPILAPWGEAVALVEALCDLPRLPPLDLPEELAVAGEAVVPTPRARVEEVGTPWGARAWTIGFTFRYGDAEVPQGRGGAAVYDAAARRLQHRDLGFERAAKEKLEEVGAELKYVSGMGREPIWSVAAKGIPALVLRLLEAGWLVEVQGSPLRQAGAMRMEVRSGIDWFDLEGEVAFGDQVARLPELLAAVRRGDRFVALPDGSRGLLPETWLGRHGLVLGLGTAEAGAIRFRKSQAGLLDVLLAAQPEVTWDDAFLKVRRELAAFERLEPADPAPGFTGTLREYQRVGLGWMGFLRRFGFGGCLADDMGLGKTVQVLALLWSRRVEGCTKPSLVVVPRSLVYNWKAEAARFAPSLRVLDLAGAKAARASARLEDHDLVLTTYGLLRRDAARLGEIQFDHVILDEAQAIKNGSSVAAKAARLLRADHRLALSGTPIENHLSELWSLFEFLNPGLLGSAAAFKGAATRAPDEETLAALARALRPFILRRTKAQVASDLPPRVEQTLWCELGEEERAQYDELRDHYRASLLGRIDEQGIAKSRMHVLEALLRLRQAALHPGLLDGKRREEPSAKLAMLLEQLQDVQEQGAKALVFSQFTSLLDLVEPALARAGIATARLDGRTRDRAGVVEGFRGARDVSTFLISLKAGGLGLNLVEAQYVFLLDPWWNPAVEAQAIDRAHRIGQTRTVFAYRLVARETIEEKILELQARKRALADAILGGESNTLRGLTRADVELLLSG